MMLATTEVRWFQPGRLPEAVEQWFQQGFQQGLQQDGSEMASILPSISESREDLYLSMPALLGLDNLGIKLRQNKLEVKWRTRELEPLCLKDCQGKLEQWLKWSHGQPVVTQFLTKSFNQTLIQIHKVRTVRRYQLHTDPVLIEIPTNETAQPGCNVELTKLTVRGDIWWSLGLEASGQDVSHIQHLQTVLEQSMQTYPGIKLQLQDSYAYPVWLQRLATEEQLQSYSRSRTL
ncbi:hypothetical protein [Leptolyngbya sp. FACHB-261]|uniref:hypothetical protein n=1 Tax=Leptolyngbya sp. FACHB-261 TaxID=2692806 RepID=UPI001687DDEC|nr:hypothetical protein [Leptolyngbya sp. FACHB-261]MBD2104982.1 hypothetical protein [Leptolyngbya sp. FACHB-261]